MENLIKAKVIDKFMKENKMSKSKFCKLCKISLSSFNKLMSGSLNFGIIILFKIAKMLKIEVYELFEE